jgi:hypothetical protein
MQRKKRTRVPVCLTFDSGRISPQEEKTRKEETLVLLLHILNRFLIPSDLHPLIRSYLSDVDVSQFLIGQQTVVGFQDGDQIENSMTQSATFSSCFYACAELHSTTVTPYDLYLLTVRERKVNTRTFILSSVNNESASQVWIPAEVDFLKDKRLALLLVMKSESLQTWRFAASLTDAAF